jgi:hypothetical protein
VTLSIITACCYAEIAKNPFVLSGIILSVVMLNVIILSVVMLNVIILSVMLNVIILSVVMLNVIILSVVMLNVVAPVIDLFCSQPYRPLAEERGRLQEEVPAVGGHLRHVFAGRKRTSGEPRRRAGINVIKLLGHYLRFTFFVFCRQAFDWQSCDYHLVNS